MFLEFYASFNKAGNADHILVNLKKQAISVQTWVRQKQSCQHQSGYISTFDYSCGLSSQKYT